MFLEKQVWVSILKTKGNKISKPFASVLEKQSVKKSIQPVVTCFYCMKKGHYVRYCRFRKSLVPKGIIKWIPDVLMVPKTSLTQKVPNFLGDQTL